MADAAACSTEFASAHVESLREALSTVDVNDDEARVEVEIEASKAHWSELTSGYVTAVEVPATESSTALTSESSSSEPKQGIFAQIANSAWSPFRWVLNELDWWGVNKGAAELKELAMRVENERVANDNAAKLIELDRLENERVAKENVEVFRSLQARYPAGFFIDENDVGPDHVQKLPECMVDKDDKSLVNEVKLIGEKFAEGAQAELFHAHMAMYDGKRRERVVLKVFKEGTPLRGLQKLLPPPMLNSMFKDKGGEEHGWIEIASCNVILGARLLKADGRFAFLMMRAWGDLRKLIDVRMLDDNNQGAPFPNNIATWCMSDIALGMLSLHAKGIVHRDLKAANVLVCAYKFDLSKIDPFLLTRDTFQCRVADFECSVGVVGTGFWRAPEILHAVKNRTYRQNPEIFSKEADVYSFGMTCYEILTGRLPFEDQSSNPYDGVIGGARPILPTHTNPEIMDMVKRCWHSDPALRPTFDQICGILWSLKV